MNPYIPLRVLKWELVCAGDGYSSGNGHSGYTGSTANDGSLEAQTSIDTQATVNDDNSSGSSYGATDGAVERGYLNTHESTGVTAEIGETPHLLCP